MRKTEVILFLLLSVSTIGYSEYETNKLDNRVKFTNPPDVCEINIYTSAGTLVPRFTKDSPVTSFDWDLKNVSGVPISSGMYIIHIHAEGIGDRILNGSAFYAR